MTEVIFLAAAESDLFAHYERLETAQPGAGEKFSVALDTGLTLISRLPYRAVSLARPDPPATTTCEKCYGIRTMRMPPYKGRPRP
jgi:hypothetical protein